MADERPGLLDSIRRYLHLLLGLFFVGLATLGVVLPLIPTTPFVLLAGFFFVRSSPRLHAWLMRSRIFGPFLDDWQTHRAIRRPVKVTALCMIPIMVSISALSGQLADWLIVVLVVLGVIGMIVVLRIPVISTQAPEEEVGAEREASAP